MSANQDITLWIARNQGVEVRVVIDPGVMLGPAVAVALIFITAGLAVAIGAGAVGWSYWWLLLPGAPAAFAVLDGLLALLFRAP